MAINYAKSYLNMSKLADTIHESTVKAGPKKYTKKTGIASRGAVQDIMADNPEMKAILDLNPSLAATIGIKNAYNSKDSPVRLARSSYTDTALIDGQKVEYDMYKFKVNKDGTGFVPLSEDEKVFIKMDVEGEGLPSQSLSIDEEYNTEISNKLLKDLKVAFPDLSQKQLGAIIGNLHHESGGFTRYQQIMGEGVSYAQWSGDRKKQFLNFAKDNKLDPKSYEAGSKFLIKELQENRKHGFSNKSFFDAFNNPDASVEDLTKIFENNYLAAGKKRMPDRIKDAEAYAVEPYFPYDTVENE